MPEFNTAKIEMAAPPDKLPRKSWSPPRVIEAEVESTEAGSVNIPEVSGGLLTS